VALRDILVRGFSRKVSPFRPGHRVELLIDGGPFFDRFVEAIEAAQSYVFIESYIVAADKTGWRVANALAERARAGVEVAMMYDGFGSIDLDEDLVQFLDAAGVKTHAFRPLSLSKRVWPWSQRNHRKILVVDGQVGVVGGMNIASEYDAVERGGEGWRDTAVCVQGPAVGDLEQLFRQLWRREKAERLTSSPLRPPEFPDGDEVRFLGNFARRDRAFIRRAYLLAITSAKTSIRIMNAYFIPDRVIRTALVRAANRGVLVEIVVGGSTDVKAALYATRALYSRFLKNGVRIYEWREKVLHAKTAVIDGEWSTVGSSNLDYLSSFRNLEVNAGIAGQRVGTIMEQQFEADRNRSQRIDLQLWRARPVSWRFFEWFFRVVARTY
jgi:cardiolipin synthase